LIRGVKCSLQCTLIAEVRDRLLRNSEEMRGAVWIALIVLWNVAFVVPLFGPLLHESDQASLLEGSVVIAQTDRVVGQPFYNYDKQFGSYWIVATALKSLGTKPDPHDVVMVGNAVSIVFFNAGLLLLVFSLAAPVVVFLLGCLLFAPALAIHAPFLAGNYLSAFFIFAQFIALKKTNSLVLPVLLAFCATGCRADAVMAQPIVLWATTRADTLAGWIRDKRLWGCIAAAAVALLLGKSITSAGAEYSSPLALFLNWKISVGYSIFGLGAGIGILLLCLVALGREGRRLKTTGFVLAGLFGLLLPFAYYTVNLYSTRHWTVALVALMCFVASGRGARLLSKTLFASRLRSAVFTLLALCAILPVFFGLRLSPHAFPRLTLSRPTLVPSADGLIPLGAYLSYSWGWNRPHRQIPDHNQATWLAALAADFGQSRVHLLVSPLASIVRLAIRLRGWDYQLTENPDALAETYAEFRALRKSPIGHSVGRLHDVLTRPGFQGVEFASPLFAGEAIVRLTPTPNSLAEALKTLREAFEGNDYHLLKPDFAVPLGEAEPGHLMVLVSQAPFRIDFGGTILTPEKNKLADGAHYYLLKFLVQDSKTLRLEGAVELAALSVLPASMSIEAY
jgi:hypothetical protein